MTYRPKTPILTALLLLTPFASSAAQSSDEYCAFQIYVNTPASKPSANTPVAGLDQNGAVFATAVTNAQGIARVCDAPKDLVDIQIGGSLCGAVTVRYLKPYWMKTRQVFVTYQNCAGEEWAVPGGCLVTIRVRDAKGNPLPGAFLEKAIDQPAAREQTNHSDQFGRIFRFVEYGSTLEATVVKEGYVAKALKEQCRRGEAFDRERILTLEH